MILLNRVLYAVAAAVFFIGLSSLFMPEFSFDNSTIKAIKIKPFKQNVSESINLGFLAVPENNFFDLKGGHWFSVVREKPSFKAGKRLKLQGIVKLSGVEGVLTDQGFVLIGQILNGGRLLRVEKGKAIIDVLGTEKVLLINNEAINRKKFKSLGFPLFK